MGADEKYMLRWMREKLQGALVRWRDKRTEKAAAPQHAVLRRDTVSPYHFVVVMQVTDRGDVVESAVGFPKFDSCLHMVAWVVQKFELFLPENARWAWGDTSWHIAVVSSEKKEVPISGGACFVTVFATYSLRDERGQRRYLLVHLRKTLEDKTDVHLGCTIWGSM